MRALADGTAEGRKVLVLGDAQEIGTALNAIYNSVEPALQIFD